MMKNKKLAALLGVLLAGSMAVSMAACGSTNNASDTKSSTSSSDTAKKDDSKKADAPSETSGFEEVPVGPSGTAEEQDKAAGPLTVGAVYFQPIDMYPASMGLKAADASFHLEADIHASEEGTDYGYGKGDFVPDLTVNYTIIDKSTGKEVEGGQATSGTFMQMNASDGPHYGANVKLDKAGTYQLKLSIESPEKNGWMLHVDPETGVKNHKFWTEPIEVTFDNWDYTPRQW
ncbi:iron transporter [Bifidobacterium longum subsp. infantis]|uniref:Iron transporter n=1 Tax=Bifidobacterium longum subsp. infantis TaxID=1682 RepID=A0AAX1LLY2_BIFLI|nr:iron transporter [Bifidobacterium longum]QSP98215.1 iron transporter [Bifidobacterium longum subsp. infantis]QSZ18462.1 iron transporter [Bifidobacterium longum subsp. infantis]QTB94014.1 iron transporter [Bifidobacterium longum subsp. infantis]